MRRTGERIEALDIDTEKLEAGRKRMEAVWRNEETDYIPILYSDMRSLEKKPPPVDFKEMFDSPLNQFLFQLHELVPTMHSASDAQLTIRANLGTGFVPTLAGLKQDIFPDKMPWLKERLSREQIETFEIPDDISQLGLMPFAIECYRFYRENMPTGFHSYLPDTQGPFDIAHEIRGNDIFLDIHDSPEFLHRLMNISTRLYILATKKLKEVLGEKADAAYHSSMYIVGGGVRVCEDTTTLISGDAIQEFVLPCIKRVLKEFGGGWIHYCGKNDALFELLLGLEEVRGINLGNPEMFDYYELMERLLDAGKVYFGAVPNTEKKSAEEHFRFVLGPLKGKRKGLIFMTSSDDVPDGSPRQIVNLWRKLQE